MRRAAGLFLLLVLLTPGPAAGQGKEEGAIDGAGRALRAEALAAMTAGDYAGAIGPLREFLARYPGQYGESTFLASCYINTARFEEAAAFLEETRKIWPGDVQFAEMLGQAYLEMGQPEKAVSVWHSVLTGDERDVPRYLQVSRAEWNAGMFDQAISTLKEARRFEKHYARLTAEIVRMEQTRGNYRGAFLEALPGFEMEDIPDLGRASGAIRSFREAGRPPELIAAVDSFAAHGKKNATFFQTLGAALLVDTGDYGRASEYLILAGSGKVPEQDVYSFVIHLYSLGDKAGDPAFEDYLGRASSMFVRRFGDSPRAPRVLLEGAEHAELAARRGGAGERDEALRAVALADSVIAHRRGRPYTEKALLIKARANLEHLHDPAAALRAVDSAQWRHPSTAADAASIRLEALVLSGRWDEAMKTFEALAASPDSSIAASGKYGKGMVLFYRGEFDESARLLSEVAAEAPWSEWANDALATAVLIRRAESGDPAVLSSFASAMSADGSGRYGEAADSLAAVAGRFPASALAPEALYQSALLLERAGRHDESVASLERVAGEWPLSRAAPRAVETLARLFEESDPEASARWYALFLERYGEDPWATRVRGRYIRLRKIMGGEATEEDET